MKFNELNTRKQRTNKRVGRGISAGQGKTAGRGTKGQGARKSPGRAGFEGGQMPLYMRLPKLRGFKSHRALTENVYTGDLDLIRGASVDTLSLANAGLISSPHAKVKLISKGELKSKKTVKLQSASKSAIAMISKAGGSFEVADRLARNSKKTDK